MSKSVKAVTALSEMDPQFAEMCSVLFGKAVDPMDVWAYVYTPDGVSKMLAAERPEQRTGRLVRKANPDQADLHAGSFKPTGRSKQFRYRNDRPNTPLENASLDKPRVMVRNRNGGYSTLMFRDNDARKKWLDDAYAGRKPSAAIAKDDTMDVVWAGEFVKADEDKRQVFGWASIVEVDGKPVVDRQGDLITPEDIEAAAYSYVVKSRKGGHQHRRTDDGGPFHASDMIESFVITPEKIAKMGLPEDTPVGWWVGYHVSDDETWNKIKAGEVTGFSVHGRGKRVPVAEVSP